MTSGRAVKVVTRGGVVSTRMGSGAAIVHRWRWRWTRGLSVLRRRPCRRCPARPRCWRATKRGPAGGRGRLAHHVAARVDDLDYAIGLADLEADPPTTLAVAGREKTFATVGPMIGLPRQLQLLRDDECDRTSPRGAPRPAPRCKPHRIGQSWRPSGGRARPAGAQPPRRERSSRPLNSDCKDGQARTGVTGTLRRRRPPPITAHAPPPPSRHPRRRRPGRRDRNRLLRDEKAALGRARDGSDGRDGRRADDPRDAAADTGATEARATGPGRRQALLADVRRRSTRDLARLDIDLGIPHGKRWARGLKSYVEYPPSYCDGVLYVNTFKGDTWAIDAERGRCCGVA